MSENINMKLKMFNHYSTGTTTERLCEHEFFFNLVEGHYSDLGEFVIGEGLVKITLKDYDFSEIGGFPYLILISLGEERHEAHRFDSLLGMVEVLTKLIPLICRKIMPTSCSE